MGIPIVNLKPAEQKQEPDIPVVGLRPVGQVQQIAKPEQAEDDFYLGEHLPIFNPLMPGMSLSGQSARIGVKHVVHSFSQMLLNPYTRDFMEGPTPVSGGKLSSHIALRLSDPDWAAMEDAQNMEVAKKVRRWSDNTLGAYPDKPLLKPVEGIGDVLSLRRVVNTIGEQGPLMALQMFVTAISPVAGFALMSEIEQGAAREEMLQQEALTGKRAGPIEREVVPQIVGLFDGALDTVTSKFQLDTLIKVPTLKRKLFNVVASMFAEPLAEGVEEFNQAFAGKIVDFEGIPGYIKELQQNGIDKDTISRVKQAMSGAWIMSTLFGGATLSLHAFEKAGKQESGQREKMVAEALAGLNEQLINKDAPNLSDDLKAAIYQEASDLKGEPVNLDEHLANTLAGKLPIYYGVPQKIAESIKKSGIVIQDEPGLVNAVYTAAGIDPNSLTVEQRDYVEQDARIRYNDAKQLGVVFSTKNMAARWGKLNKSIMEEMVRRLTALRVANMNVETANDFYKNIGPQDLGAVEALSFDKEIPEQQREKYAGQIAAVKNGIERGTLTPEYASRVLHDVMKDVQTLQPLQVAHAIMPDITFVTSKGSSYVLSGNKTTRTKTLHEGHERSDVGLKEQSQLTLYVSPDDAARIGQHGTLAGKKAVVISGNRLFNAAWNTAANKWGLSPTEKTGIQFSTVPEIGKAPVELWNIESGVANKWHAGNEIVSIFDTHAQQVNQREGQRLVDFQAKRTELFERPCK